MPSANTQIARAKRKLSQMRQEEPLVLRRIANLTLEQQALAKRTFYKAVSDLESELKELTAKSKSSR
jgi:hypothetical protein